VTGRPPVEVAVGVLIRPDGRFLLASRPAGKPYAGYWEFPGGKLEVGESVEAALARELREELGLEIGPAHRWVTLEHDYPHAYVRLHFCRVFDWHGEIAAHEGQAFGFFTVDDLPDGPLLPATVPVMKWLRLPQELAISAAATMGAERFRAALDARLADGLRLLQVREPAWDDAQVEQLLKALLPRARAAGARVVLSSRHGASLWSRGDGVHLTARDLQSCAQRPPLPLVGASCHTREELAHAARLGLDYAVLGAVGPSASHPGERGLGWSAWRDRAREAGLPVYAIGGLTVQDLPTALAAGAHGIAQLTGAWSARR
jgi:8-oxo-dGTP diphosphatase